MKRSIHFRMEGEPQRELESWEPWGGSKGIWSRTVACSSTYRLKDGGEPWGQNQRVQTQGLSRDVRPPLLSPFLLCTSCQEESLTIPFPNICFCPQIHKALISSLMLFPLPLPCTIWVLPPPKSIGRINCALLWNVLKFLMYLLNRAYHLCICFWNLSSPEH